jgi:hypothetical protein
MLEIEDGLFGLRLDDDRPGLITTAARLQESQQVDGTDDNQDSHDSAAVGFVEIELKHL